MMWHDSIYDLTPVQKTGGMFFKRDDLFSPDGVHSGSKFRQLIWLFSRKPYPGVASGAVTGSPQLPMVAACAAHYGMKCVQLTGSRKNMAASGERLGAQTVLVNPGYGPLLNKRASDYAREHGFLHIETNITESKDIEPFHRVGAQQVQNIPDTVETLILPAGSRNSATSILYGLKLFPPKRLKRIIFMNIHPNLARKEKWMWDRLKVCGVSALPYEIQTFDCFKDGWTNYSKQIKFDLNGIQFHPRYESKVWCYMRTHPDFRKARPFINHKSLFWIIGGPIT